MIVFAKLVGRYMEILESVTDEEIQEVRDFYGVKLSHDVIDQCLEDAGACF